MVTVTITQRTGVSTEVPVAIAPAHAEISQKQLLVERVNAQMEALIREIQHSPLLSASVKATIDRWGATFKAIYLKDRINTDADAQNKACRALPALLSNIPMGDEAALKAFRDQVRTRIQEIIKLFPKEHWVDVRNSEFSFTYLRKVYEEQGKLDQHHQAEQREFSTKMKDLVNIARTGFAERARTVENFAKERFNMMDQIESKIVGIKAEVDKLEQAQRLIASKQATNGAKLENLANEVQQVVSQVQTLTGS